MSEVWVGYHLRPAIILRGGISAYTSEYEIDAAALPEGITETRYRHMAMLVFFGLKLI